MHDGIPLGVAASEAWASVPHPVLVVDRDGIVGGLSDTARAALPDVAVGTALQDAEMPWLARAHRDFLAAETDAGSEFRGDIGAQEFTARPTTLPDGQVAWWLMARPDAVLRQTQVDLARERERAAVLDEASAVLMASLNLERCMAATVRLAAVHLADAAVLVAPASEHRLPVVCCGPDGSVEQRWVEADPADVTGLSEALRGFPPVPSRWIDPATVPNWLIPTTLSESLGSVVITPLPGHGVPAGALVLLRRESHTAFSEGEEIFARLFAARAGAALSAARLYAEQSAITRTLLRELLPPRLHRLHGFELAGGYRASEDHELVGGDFYDVHPAEAPGDETLVVLGDVCGKGLEAALLTGKIRNTLQALAPLADQHEDVLKLLNSALLSPDNSRFATVVLASVVRHDTQLNLRLTCAGHPAPLIVRHDGSVETADTRGVLVGALPQFKARSFETTLEPGETCLLFTDGVTEARGGPLGGEIFGDQRLSEALAECLGMPAEAVVERIMMLTSQWVGRLPHDDIAVVAITAPRRTHLTAVDGHTAGRYTA